MLAYWLSFNISLYRELRKVADISDDNDEIRIREDNELGVHEQDKKRIASLKMAIKFFTDLDSLTFNIYSMLLVNVYSVSKFFDIRLSDAFILAFGQYIYRINHERYQVYERRRYSNVDFNNSCHFLILQCRISSQKTDLPINILFSVLKLLKRCANRICCLANLRVGTL
jgi:hypothetical protein